MSQTKLLLTYQTNLVTDMSADFDIFNKEIEEFLEWVPIRREELTSEYAKTIDATKTPVSDTTTAKIKQPMSTTGLLIEQVESTASPLEVAVNKQLMSEIPAKFKLLIHKCQALMLRYINGRISANDVRMLVTLLAKYLKGEMTKEEGTYLLAQIGQKRSGI